MEGGHEGDGKQESVAVSPGTGTGRRRERRETGHHVRIRITHAAVLSSHVGRWKDTEGRATSRQTGGQAGKQADR